MDEPNVNKLNGIPNFGHGLPPDGVVIAGVTDVPQEELEVSEETKEPQVELEDDNVE